MKISEITSFLEAMAPLNLQEKYDNSGLITGHWDTEVQAALISLDCTEEVVEEAIQKGAQLIIAHHPIVFSGLKRFNGSNYVERTVIKAIQNNIAIYAIHTNLDNVMEGVNKKIGEKLGLSNLKILSPKNEEETVGSGMIGEFKEALSEIDFLKLVKKNFDAGVVRYTNLLDKPVKKVAFCGGSGSFLLNQAIHKKADVFLSSDFKYHQFFDAENKIVIADIGHYEAENCTKELIYEILTEKFSTFTLHFSEVDTNPIKYL